MKKQKKPKLKIILSVFIGLGISFVSFLVFIIIQFFVQKTFLSIVLFISYVSIIVFLILWNIIFSKRIYFIWLIPLLCLIAGIAVIGHQFYIKNIPAMYEDGIYIHRYSPTRENNLLAKLDTESNFKINDNFPVLDGATALYPVYAAFFLAVYPIDILYDENYIDDENYYQKIRDILLWNRTDGAYDNLFDGEVDIIFCAGPSEKQLNRFIENEKDIIFVPIGREAFVFFVNSKNRVNNLTIENIQGIYSGKINNWRELNGRNQRIKAFQRPEFSGSQTMLEKIMDDVPIRDPRLDRINSMGEIFNEVAVYRNFSDSIGYSFLFFATEMVKNEQIKLLSINGIYPSTETIQKNIYPFSDNFYAIYIESDDKNENIEPFIEWILSEQGQELIQKTGYVPVRSIF